MKAKFLLSFAAGLVTLGMGSAQSAGSGPTATAVVDDGGHLARGFHATSAHKLARGRYQVLFSMDVSACSYTASAGLPGSSGTSLRGIVSVAAREGQPKGVFVETFDPRGKPLNLGFHMIVAC